MNKSKSKCRSKPLFFFFLFFFTSDLKDITSSANLWFPGRKFQSRGTLTAKAVTFSLETRCKTPVLRSEAVGGPSNLQYRSVSPWSALNLISKILKWTVQLTGNQWKEARTGVIWSHLFEFVTKKNNWWLNFIMSLRKTLHCHYKKILVWVSC